MKKLLLLIIAVVLIAASCNKTVTINDDPKLSIPVQIPSVEVVPKDNSTSSTEGKISANNLVLPKTDTERDFEIDQGKIKDVEQDVKLEDLDNRTTNLENTVNNQLPLKEDTYRTPVPVPAPAPKPEPIQLATVNFGITTLPLAADVFMETEGDIIKTIAVPKTNVLMWKNTITVGIRSVELRGTLKFRMVGSFESKGLTNFHLFINGNEVSTTNTINPDGYINFKFSPVTLEAGNSIIQMVGDIVGGEINRNFSWMLRNNMDDIEFVDTKYDQKIWASWTGSPMSGVQTLKFIN
ncbi:hypothetical protein M0R04_06415 [Candidatus Dojkabacteria bacterium]|jgi:hypothetical protein|nr:hypothetical protein [Candidatus Dojkabacteria bacterium]